MAGATGPSTKGRLTSKEKGKGRPKRPAAGSVSDDGAGNGDGENDQDIVRITKRQATGRKSASRPTVPEVSTEGLPAGLAIVAPTTSLSDDEDSTPTGILQSLGPSLPPKRLQRKTRPPLATACPVALRKQVQQMGVEKVNTEAAFIELGTALDLSEEQKKQLSIEAMQWHRKYMEKIADLQEMNERLQEVQAGREIARGQAKIWEMKKEYVEDKAAESSTMAEQLAAANGCVRLLEIESQEAIAQLGETVELKEKFRGSLVRIAELEAQIRLSSRQGIDGVGDVALEREKGEDRDPAETPTITQQTPMSVEPDSEQAKLVKSQANIIAVQESTMRRIMEETDRFTGRLRLLSGSTAVNVPLTNQPSIGARCPSPTPEYSYSDLDADDPAATKDRESRDSVLANMTKNDVYGILRKQYGLDACGETTYSHDTHTNGRRGKTKGRTKGFRGDIQTQSRADTNSGLGTC